MTPKALRRGLSRIWARDTMVFVGGVAFFALLAGFPAVSLLLGAYRVFVTPDQALRQTEALMQLMPAGARQLFELEITRLTTGSLKVLSYQSFIAFIVGIYASHRGVKALLIGLNYLYGEPRALDFIKFNILAFVVAVAAFIFFTAISGLVVGLRVIKAAGLYPQAATTLRLGTDFLVAIGMASGLAGLYRFAMSHSHRLDWRAAGVGGAVASALSLFSSWGCAFYVGQIADLGATYGSVAAVVVLLIWLSWNINAVFYGAAVATEMEISLNRRWPPPNRVS